MNTKFLISAISLAIPMIVGLPLMAHHGTGVSYDASKPMTMKATVTEFRYANPHPQLFFDVKDDKGNVVHWSGEFYPNPAQLVQVGWGKRRSEAALAAGTVINITVAPARVGGPVGAIMKLANEKGEILLGVDANSTPGAAPAPGTRQP
jgi:Family of unknown function (DUF6152)